MKKVIAGTIFLLVAAIILGFFRNGMLLFGDTDLTYHFGGSFFGMDKVYIWNDYFQSGIFDFDKFSALYLKKIIFLINFSTSLYFFSYLWYFLPILFYMSSFYFLIKELLKFYKINYFGNFTSLILSILALANGILALYYGEVLFILSLIMLNLFLLFFVKNLLFLINNNKNNYSYIVIAGLFLSQINIYIHIIFLLAYALIILSILNFKFIIKRWKIFLMQVTFWGIIFLILNLASILPVAAQIFLNNSNINSIINYDVNSGWVQAVGISKNIYFYELLGLKSYHVFNNFPQFFYFLYYIPLGIILYYIATRRGKLSYFFLAMLMFLIIAVGLSYGIRPGYEKVYSFFWNYIPFITIFRTIFKFSFFILYAIIILLVYILARIRNKKEYFLIILLISIGTLISLNYYFQPEIKQNLKQYKIPDYYFQIEKNEIFKQNEKIGNNILSPQINWHVQYEWAPQRIDSMDILPYFYGDMTFVNGAQYTPDVQYIFNDYFDFMLRHGKMDELKYLLSLRNIKYITYQNDIRIPDNKSAVYVVKSNYEIPPVEGEIFSDKFKKEICSRMLKFGEITFCEVKNSLFTPVISIKENRFNIIKNERYLNLLNESVTFIPFNKRSEKNHSQINLMEENPLILNDLIKMKIISEEDTQIFEENSKVSLPENNINKEIYPSLKPFEIKKCARNFDCNFYFFQDINPGNYDLYFVHYFSEGEAFDRKYSIRIMDDVDESFIKSTIENINLNKSLSNLTKKDEQEVFFNSKDNNFVGNVNLQGSNVVIKAIVDDDYFSRGRFYIVKKNTQENNYILEKESIEFKKINPTKYRVRVHNANNIFHLTLSENFNQGWNLYKSLERWAGLSESDLSGYQAKENWISETDLKEFAKGGAITDLGKIKENINFISENIERTIQNNNLPDGHFYETWFKKPVDDNQNHFKSNGHANSWIINTDDICKDKVNCIKNSDGTYDFELIMEFWPQRLLYVGLGISNATLLACLGYLGYDYYRRRKCFKIEKNDAKNKDIVE